MTPTAVDMALWDLKSRLADLPLFQALGARRAAAPIYGSGGCTSYTDQELCDQLAGWVESGIPHAELFVDADGAYSARHAIALSAVFADCGVSYFEEPVSSDHLDQLADVRQHAPRGRHRRRIWLRPLVLQEHVASGSRGHPAADLTRCLGVSSWRQAAEVALPDARAPIPRGRGSGWS